jgi:hypothetical protein
LRKILNLFRHSDEIALLMDIFHPLIYVVMRR